MTKRHYLLAPFLLGGLLAGTASAAALSGSFNLSGVITVTGGSNDAAMSFRSLGDAETFIFDLGTGPDLSQMNETQQTILNITLEGQPVGEDFDPFPFIRFPGVSFVGDPGTPLPDLLINHIDAGDGGDNCGVAPVGTNPGQTCTPRVEQPAGSGILVPGPFTFTNNCVPNGLPTSCLPGGTPGTVDSTDATWVFRGVTSDGLSTWSASFTATFRPQSFQDVLDDLAEFGTVTNTYAGKATLEILPNPIPEPGTFALIGLGLIMATVAAKRLKKS